MYRKVLFNATAMTMAAVMAFAPAVTTFAADEVPAQEVPAEGQSEAPAEGSGEVWSGTIINPSENEGKSYEVSGKDADVAIDGNVNSTEPGKAAVTVSDGAEAAVANVDENGDLEGDGKANVSGTLAGIEAKEGAKVVVNGNVNASGSEGVDGKSAGELNGSKKTESKQGSGILTDGTATVVVYGDSIGLTEGILINPVNGQEGGLVIVEGTVGSTDKRIKSEAPGKIGIVYHNDNGNSFKEAGDTEAKAKAILKALPEVYAYEYSNQALSITYTVDSFTEGNTIFDQYLQKGIDKKLNYIVRVDESSLDKGIEISGYNEKMKQDYDLITVGVGEALKVAVAEGYEIASGSTFKAVANADGTYTIRVTDNSGAITIKAVLKRAAAPVVEARSEEQGGSSQSQPREEEEGTFIFATFTITDSSLPEVLGASRDGGALDGAVTPSAVVKVKAGALTANQYKSAFIDSVKNAPMNAIVRLETSAPSCIDKMMMEALAQRPDLTFQVAFPLQGQLKEITVPAGYDVMSLLDEKGYCGFLYLNAVFTK